MDDDPGPDPAGEGTGGGGPEDGPAPEEELLSDETDAYDSLRFDRWRKRSTAGVVMTGIAFGLQEALVLPKKEPAFVIKATGEPDGPQGPIDLRFDPDSPANTVAVIRPWPAEGEPDVGGGAT